MEARKAVSGDMENIKEKFLQSHLLQDDHKGFLEDVEITLTNKMQGSDSTKREYQWMRTLKTLHPDGLSIKSNYSFFLCSLGNIWSLATLTFPWEPKIVFCLKEVKISCAGCILQELLCNGGLSLGQNFWILLRF